TRLTRTLSTSRYDSAGRLIRETLYDYPPVDAGAQAPQTVRPNGSALLRSFVGYSVEELTTRLEVQKAGSDTAETVFSRSYDGLGRLKQVKIGPRIEDYDYVTQTLLIDKRTAYAQDKNRKRVIQYNYLPQLTEQPTMLDA
ncbi:hypothetical protein SCB29_35095, partial [Paraburkholderia sp. SIMBA_055]